MRKLVLFAFVITFITSCKEAKNSFEKGFKEGSDLWQSEENKTLHPNVKLYALNGGTVQVNKLDIFAQDDTYKGQTKTFADAFYVIEHPKGRLLWDAGIDETLIGKEPFTSPDGAFTISRKDSVVSQLKAINLTPNDFKYIALSHTHFDHSGSASKFKEATWLVQEKEYNYITSEAQQKGVGYKAIAKLNKIKKINGDYDVFGDQTVIIKSTPGHTPGHQSLYLNLPQTGSVLLTGDLYHFHENRNNKGVPKFNFNVEQTLKSMTAFEAFAKEKNAKVYIQHSIEDFNKLPKYPKYLN